MDLRRLLHPESPTLSKSDPERNVLVPPLPLSSSSSQPSPTFIAPPPLPLTSTHPFGEPSKVYLFQDSSRARLPSEETPSRVQPFKPRPSPPILPSQASFFNSSWIGLTPVLPPLGTSSATSSSSFFIPPPGTFPQTSPPQLNSQAQLQHRSPRRSISTTSPSPSSSSSSSLPPRTPDHHSEPLPTFGFKQPRPILPKPSPRTPTLSASSSTSALDLLAVVAQISTSDQGEGSRKRAKLDLGDRNVVVVEPAIKKKRKGRGLDPEKTKLMIFPPPLPSRLFVPLESEGYRRRPPSNKENLYAPTYTKGKDSRSRVAFCERCGEGDLPTRMSGYGYHLLHVHNLSSHAPYEMPAPLAVRTLASEDSPSIALEKEDAFTTPSPCLEGECPFDGSSGGGKCIMGGWHRLNNWRETMNTHFSRRGLELMPKKT